MGNHAFPINIMKKVFFFIVIILCASACRSAYALPTEEICYDFETGEEGWKIPDWAYYQKDHKAETSEVSSDFASSGKNSLKMVCNFPGNLWAAGVVEVEKDYNLYGYDSISVDVYLPRSAPKELLQARLILTVGDGWLFTEMRYAVALERGKWVTIKAKLESYEVENSNWKGKGERRLYHNINKVKKIAVRVEYDAAPPYRIGPKYKGPIYIDNLVIKPGDLSTITPPADYTSSPAPAVGDENGAGGQ